MKKQFIAIVDDDHEDIAFVQEALQNSTKDFEIIAFLSGKAFIEAMAATEDVPILALLDYNMPQLNGEEVLLQLKGIERLSDVKVVYISTGMTPALKERLLALGAYCCYPKPVTYDAYQQLADKLVQLATDLQSGVVPPVFV